MRTRPGKRRSRAVRGAILALACGACAAGLGCYGLDEVDAKVEKLLLERSNLIDGGSIVPTAPHDAPDSYDRPGQDEKEPPTTNPPASALRYDIAKADRDVASRLDEYFEPDPDAMRLDLREVFHISQETGREYQTAEEDYILSAIRLLIQRHLWSPRFFDDISAQVDGAFNSDAQVALRVMNDLRVTQRLPYGGEVEARLIMQATQQLRDEVSGEYTQSTQLVLNANVPLLRNAGLIAQEDLIQAERNLVYAARTFEDFRRSYFVSLAQDYFDLIAQLEGIENAKRSLAGRQYALDRAEARVAAGRDPASEARSFEQDVLSAKSNLVAQRERYQLALDRFKTRLGIPVENAVALAPFELELPEPEATPGEAAQTALTYRLDLQNQRDQIGDARRAIANARNQILPDLNFVGSVTTSTLGDQNIGGFNLAFDNSAYSAGVTFGLPLDREIERLNLRSAIIALQQQIRTYDQFRDNVILTARQQRRVIDQQRFALQLAERRVEINKLRIEELTIKEVGGLELRNAQDQLLEAENARDLAQRDLRNAILDYLRVTGTLRVKPNGEYQPLPGMPGAAGVEDIGPPGATVQPPGMYEVPMGPPPPEDVPAEPAGPAVQQLEQVQIPGLGPQPAPDGQPGPQPPQPENPPPAENPPAPPPPTPQDTPHNAAR